MIRQGHNTTHTTVSLRLAHAVTPFPTLRPLAPLLPTYLEFHLVPVTPTQKPWAALRTSGMSRDPRLRHQRSLWAPPEDRRPHRGPSRHPGRLHPTRACGAQPGPKLTIRGLRRLTAGGVSVVALGNRRADWPGMGRGWVFRPRPHHLPAVGSEGR